MVLQNRTVSCSGGADTGERDVQGLKAFLLAHVVRVGAGEGKLLFL